MHRHHPKFSTRNGVPKLTLASATANLKSCLLFKTNQENQGRGRFYRDSQAPTPTQRQIPDCGRMPQSTSNLGDFQSISLLFGCRDDLLNHVDQIVFETQPHWKADKSVT